MKIKHIDFGVDHGHQIVRPFRPDKCRIQLWQYQHAADNPKRRHDEKVVVSFDLTPGEVVCAIQRLRRFLKDRAVAAESDFQRGGYYNNSDADAIYQSREDT